MGALNELVSGGFLQMSVPGEAFNTNSVGGGDGKGFWSGGLLACWKVILATLSRGIPGMYTNLVVLSLSLIYLTSQTPCLPNFCRQVLPV